MKTITFALQKGGVGKTSMSVSVAAQLTKFGKKVIIIDSDPQGNSTSWLIEDLENEFSDILFGDCKVTDAICKTQIENLDIIPTAGVGGSLNKYSEREAAGKPYAVSDIMPELSSLGYDYCIIDTSPSFKALEKACIMASDEVIAVLTLSLLGTDGLQIFTRHLAEFKKDFRLPEDRPIFNKVIFNSRNKSIKHQGDLLDQYEAGLNAGFLKFVVPVDQAFERACGAHLSINEVNAKPETIQAIADIARSL